MISFLKKIPIYFWTLWCLLIFAIILLIIYPMMVIGVYFGGKAFKRNSYVIPYYTAKTALILFGIRMNTYGEMDTDEQYIYISNHSSNLDPLITASQTVRGKFLGKAEVLRYPIFGFALKHLYISVRRNDKEDRERSLRDMTKALNKGESLIIYPEGTRNRTSDVLNRFHKGAFELSKKTGVPIAMLTCINSYELMPGAQWIVCPGTLECYWDGPFNAEKDETFEQFKMRLKEIMHKRMLIQYPDGKFW